MSTFTERQIVKSLREHDGGQSATDIFRKLSISLATFYQWKHNYVGFETHDLFRLNYLEQENSRF